MIKFRTISYGKMLYETLRAYFSVNDQGEMSVLYQICAAIVQPLQDPFDAYHTFRVAASMVANFKWQIGQLTNVLNYFFDTSLQRIFITQSVVNIVSDSTFAYDPITYDDVFENAYLINEREFGDGANKTTVAINVPVSVAGTSLSQITATLEQIRLPGIQYVIQTF